MSLPDQAFIDKFYMEALVLLQESRMYMLRHGNQNVNSLSPEQSLYISTEIARMTTRLTEIIAWLLMHRALCNNRFLQLQNPSPRLTGDPKCMEDSTRDIQYPLHPDLIKLLVKTRNMYIRLKRIDNNEQ